MPFEKRNGIVDLIRHGNIKKRVAVEIRDHHGTRMISDLKRGPWRFRKKTVGLSVRIGISQ